MVNLAGVSDCDIIMRAELEEAHIPITQLSFRARNTEVPYSIMGELNGWVFTRAWYYWVATSSPGAPLPFSLADPLHKECGGEVRVSGHCGALSPREWYKEPWHVGVPLYHVDSQRGLNVLAETIRIAGISPLV